MEDKNNNGIPDAIEDYAKNKSERFLAMFERQERKLQRIGTHVSVALELMVALLVFIACIFGVISIFPALLNMIQEGAEGRTFILFLERIFTVVVGIEFLKMLCKPSSENVLETIVFLVARHMILGEMTPLEDLFCVISIVVLVLVKRYLVSTHNKVYHPEMFATTVKSEPGKEREKKKIPFVEPKE